jgi:hypothetical protein
MLSHIDAQCCSARACSPQLRCTGHNPLQTRQIGAACRHVAVVKNEIKIGKVKARYDATREALQDLLDKWTQSLRRKKKVKRKQVRVSTKGDEAAAKQCAPPPLCIYARSVVSVSRKS